MAKSRGHFAAAKTARNAREKRGLSEHEAGAVDQQYLSEQSDAHPDESVGEKRCSPRASGSSGLALRQPPLRVS